MGFHVRNNNTSKGAGRHRGGRQASVAVKVSFFCFFVVSLIYLYLFLYLLVKLGNQRLKIDERVTPLCWWKFCATRHSRLIRGWRKEKKKKCKEEKKKTRPGGVPVSASLKV